MLLNIIFFSGLRCDFFSFALIPLVTDDSVLKEVDKIDFSLPQFPGIEVMLS